MKRSLSILGILLIAALVSGCGPSGPPRYPVSGTVPFKGQPVPLGSVLFQPDTAAGNEGPGTNALIKDGKFSTPPDKGAISGPHIVTVYGYDGGGRNPDGGPYGNSLFPGYRIKVDLPEEPSAHDFAVP